MQTQLTSTSPVADPRLLGVRGDQADPAALGITVPRNGGSSVVRVSGELDMASAPKLAAALRCLCLADGGDLQIDIATMSFCDCSGLSVLLAAARDCRGRGGQFALVNPTPPLRRLIGLAGLDEALGMRPAGTDATPAVVAHQDGHVQR